MSIIDSFVTSTGIDVDRDTGHDAAQRELGKSIYPKGELMDRLLAWLDELLLRLMRESASLPGGWFTIALLLVLLAVAVVVAVRVARRTMRTDRGAKTLFGAEELSAAEHRIAAERFAAQGDWAPAIRQRLRAVARHLEETAVLVPMPGRTASELGRDAGAAIPGLADELRGAAVTFNDVSYGERPGTEAGYRSIVVLDDHLRTNARPGADIAVSVGQNADWVQVR